MKKQPSARSLVVQESMARLIQDNIMLKGDNKALKQDIARLSARNTTHDETISNLQNTVSFLLEHVARQHKEIGILKTSMQAVAAVAPERSSPPAAVTRHAAPASPAQPIPSETTPSGNTQPPKFELEDYLKQVAEIVLDMRVKLDYKDQTLANAIFALENRIKKIEKGLDATLVDGEALRDEVRRLSSTVNLYFTDQVEKLKDRVEIVAADAAVRDGEVSGLTVQIDKVLNGARNHSNGSSASGTVWGQFAAAEVDTLCGIERLLDLEERFVSVSLVCVAEYPANPALRQQMQDEHQKSMAKIDGAGTKDQLTTYFHELTQEMYGDPEHIIWNGSNDERFWLRQRVVEKCVLFDECKKEFDCIRRLSVPL